MSIVGKIGSLFFDKDKTRPLFPRTKVSAVSDEAGRGLEDILRDKVNVSEINKFTQKIDKTLTKEGYAADAFSVGEKILDYSNIMTEKANFGFDKSNPITINNASPVPQKALVQNQEELENITLLVTNGNGNKMSYNIKPMETIYISICGGNQDIILETPSEKWISIHLEYQKSLKQSLKQLFKDTTLVKDKNSFVRKIPEDVASFDDLAQYGDIVDFIYTVPTTELYSYICPQWMWRFPGGKFEGSMLHINTTDYCDAYIILSSEYPEGHREFSYNKTLIAIKSSYGGDWETVSPHVHYDTNDIFPIHYYDNNIDIFLTGKNPYISRGGDFPGSKKGLFSMRCPGIDIGGFQTFTDAVDGSVWSRIILPKKSEWAPEEWDLIGLPQPWKKLTP